MNNFTSDAIELLKAMIAIPSVSGDEKRVADHISKWMIHRELHHQRKGNNLWVWAGERDASKPTLLLNSHLDTVKPGNNWHTDPYTPLVNANKITGLGSNDAGASVVALIAAFRHLSSTPQPYNLVLAITAEEENSGDNGILSILPELGKIDLGIVGEPTQMQMAIAEKGLLVLDCYAHGKTGHAARDEGENAIYKALHAIEWLQNHQFTKTSSLLGPVKITITQINAGTQHNVVPDICHFVVDIRINEHYTNKEIYTKIKEAVNIDVTARSFRLNSSCFPQTHAVVLRGKELGMDSYGSPTTSDQAVMDFPTLKIGPGNSARSHTANEFIFDHEIETGINTYIQLLDQLTFKQV
jgi:acetylornithine deacetylase